MRLRRRITGPIAFAGVVAVVLSCGEIREDEMLCEEAVSRLDECCPEIEPRRLNCIHQEGCGNDLEPIFTPAASDCLRDRPCDVLRTQGICDGLRQLSFQPYPHQSRIAFEKEACR
jgi:hypothetical protein